MNTNIYKPLYLARVIEGLWLVAATSLGENHLLTQAFETALRTNDPDMMERAIRLLGGSPESVRKRILFGAKVPA